MGDLDRKKSFLSGDIAASDLINAELPDSMSLYYGKVRGRRVSLGKVSTPQRSLRWEGGQLCIDRIFATCLPQEEAGRYYYSS